jgi:phenylalanyl-tRNA synthetase beta chain
MKLSYQWLKSWIDIPWDARELGARLTMAGFELEALDSADSDDPILELNITPNRGDALSVLGIAREIAALSGNSLIWPALAAVKAQHGESLPVQLDTPAACPKFVGRIIRGIDIRAATPEWITSRLQRVGVRSISPLVDVTNYVLLELGQPMHAYDLRKVRGAITVRAAQAGEKLTLLDGTAIVAEADVLLIADVAGAVGVAGIMGGERTAVDASTTDVFLEVAYFSPEAIVGRARRLGLQTDASQRFERGVDPALQEIAMERATALIVSIARGQPGPVHVTQAEAHLPKRLAVSLRRTQLRRLLGAAIEPARVSQTLTSLGMRVSETTTGWDVIAPTHRFDIGIEADLIEEVARIVGYAAIPESDAVNPQRFRELRTQSPLERSVLEALAGRGYQEAITLAFVDPALQSRLFPNCRGVALSNPISSDLAVMRASLWPGLLRATLENQRRQQDRIRLFEHGTRFAPHETDTLAGIACGARQPEQWATEARSATDFFDVKSDLEALFVGTGAPGEFTFGPAAVSCLHPGRAALVKRNGQEVGRMGELHPALVRELGLTYSPVLFELDYANALHVVRPNFHEISHFPQVRRDLAVIVDENVPFSAVRERVVLVAPSLLQNCLVFDVYRGPGIETGRKSVALGLIFQDFSRTLRDEDIDGVVASVMTELRVSLNARIRE